MRWAVLQTMRGRRASGSVEEFCAIGQGELIAFAERNGVAGPAVHELVERGILSKRSKEWLRLHEGVAKKTATLMQELDSIGATMDGCGIDVVALKNAGIARALFPCRGCCPMGDVDVLIERDRFLDAHHLVLELGYQLASRGTVEPADLQQANRSGGAEYHKVVDGQDVWLELQWRPIAGRWIRRDQEPDGAELIARSRPIEGTKVRILSPVDNMIQVCLHTAKHSYVRAPGIRLHTDVDRLVAYDPPDWKDVVAMASRLRVKTPVYFSLALAAALLETPIPEWVLEALSPPRWKVELVTRWLQAVDVFEPHEKKFSRPGMMVFHALLYDDFPGLVASVAGTDPDHIGMRDLPANIRRGLRRMYDLATRYQP